MPKDLLDTLAEGKVFNTLVQCINLAGLVDYFKGKGPFTFFAPDDDAFDKLPAHAIDRLFDDPERLRKVMAFHCMPGKLETHDLVRLDFSTTIEGARLRLSFESGRIMVDNAYIISGDKV